MESVGTGVAAFWLKGPCAQIAYKRYLSGAYFKSIHYSGAWTLRVGVTLRVCNVKALGCRVYIS